MPIDAKRSRQSFQKLGRELTRVTKKPQPEHVHKFRTYSRRVEAVLSEVALKRHRNDEKLLDLLARLRKKAGRVRDLDVQIGCLRSLKAPQANGHKSQLMNALVEERAQRERKLAKAFDLKTTAEIRKRLKRSAHEISIPKDSEPLALTLNKLAQLGRGHAPLSEKTLHQYRIIGKRARYVAELDGDDPHARNIVEQLKRSQDVIGDWHDWLKLTEKAERLLGDVRQSALVAMLRNVTQAKFRQSVQVVTELRTTLFAGLEKREPASASKPAAGIKTGVKTKTVAQAAVA
jgi:CHAD domain-containing protein